MGYSRSENVKSVKKKIKGNGLLVREPTFEWTAKQKIILDTMNDNNTDCVIVNALAGTGKTTLAVYSALQHLQRNQVEKVIYVRTAVEASHSKIGYLKGSMDEKFGPYAEILYERAKDFLNPSEVDQFIKDGKFVALPISFLRGHDFKNCIVIGDEMQNAYLNEIMTLATRMSENSKLFILADDDQCDLPKNAQNEFSTFVSLFSDDASKEHDIHYFELKEEMDVMRSKFVRYISKKYRNHRKKLSS